jgi:proteasome lid subunit RPN8/RPN11
MRIDRELYDQMVAHAQADAPNECCGVMGTRDGEAVVIYRATNIHHSPLRYEIDGDELLRIYQDTEKKGLDIGVIYHSHTRSQPYPSQTDINLAAGYPDALYVIVGLASEQPEVRAYEIRDGKVADAELSLA